jgi:RND family efflux transporter MFP subunit
MIRFPSLRFDWRAPSLLLAGLCLMPLTTRSAEVSGLVYPMLDIQLSVQVGGLVQKLHTKLGQAVKEGQTLVEFDASVQQLELKRKTVIAQDTSELESTRTRAQVYDELYKLSETATRNTRSVSVEELLKLKLDKVSAEGRMQQLEAQKQRELIERDQAQLELQQKSVRAPINGVIADILVDPGEWAKPGDIVMRLVDTSSVDLRMHLPPVVAASFKTGARVNATFEATRGNSVSAEGHVLFVSPVADGASGLVDVRVRFLNSRGLIRAGSKGHIADAELARMR